MHETNPSEGKENIDATMVQGNVKRLRAVMQDEHNIVIPNQCDKFIARCLRQKDENCDDAVKYILAYNVAISNLRYWDVTMLPSASRELYSTGIATQLKTRDAGGHCIYILRPALWDPQKIHFEQAAAFLWMLTEYANAELEEMQKNGCIYIWDYKDYSLQHILAAKPGKVLTLAKWGKVILHDNVEDLLKHIDGKYLPTTIGGELDPEECDDHDVMQGVFDADQHFIDMMDIGFPANSSTRI